MAELKLEDFADRIAGVMPVVMRGFARHLFKELHEGEITLPKILILEFLDKEGKARMNTLARFMSVSTAAMTGIVDRLVKSGYVKRIYQQEDRRIIEIGLTAKGSGLVKKISKKRRDIVVKIFSRISDADRKHYLRILLQMKDMLNKENRG